MRSVKNNPNPLVPAILRYRQELIEGSPLIREIPVYQMPNDQILTSNEYHYLAITATISKWKEENGR
jgi:hypothetical protein